MKTTIPILFENEHLLVVDKPHGWQTVVKGGGNNRRCLTTWLRRHRRERDLAPAHRLDRDTSGCQLFGRTAAAVAALEERFRQRAVEKLYLALCRGTPPNRTGTLRRSLSRWQGGHRPVRVVKGKGGLPAETAYEVLCPVAHGPDEPRAAVSLIRFAPRTGRTHQIRVHAEALGHPILGDDQYGDRAANRDLKAATGLARQALHAWQLVLDCPLSGMRVSVTAPLPADLAAVLDEAAPGWRQAGNPLCFLAR